MGVLGEAIVLIAVIIGLVGAVVQVVPGGGFLVGVAAVVWAVVTGGTVGWTVGTVAVVAVLGAEVGKYVIAGRYLGKGGVPTRTLVIGAALGVVGFFVIPVIGLPIGFVAGVYAAESSRLRDQGEAWRSTTRAMRAVGLAILIELSGALIATGALLIGMWQT
ncbi:hypothetical protein SAMN05216184_103202 [Georgenia satyanarayanai]|uniref:DUF456 domain-containing protein n=1 Tax=Georgenia satyanarayanai TaxID=860221 RepID=A0A2Y9A9S1_9MICO|nr:DUF456 domain-containing protein [Georgenia satyanarayanai]PYG00629.1 hypothetical protein A8987_103202 [Georgenia satyanarayanai]SSA40018.1 hypothetical protein SAMN05216184_103202 [Georgenia satyanarayanai]